ncbi:MAG: hypothetical protein JXR37_19775 [Kiritimatiellae bacterium]|nr:hypothetical protein [Kiritimatiellia bacterium]
MGKTGTTIIRALSTTVRKELPRGLDVVTISRPWFQKYYITAYPDPDGPPFSLFDEMLAFVRENEAQIILQDVFASAELYQDGMAALGRAAGKANWPVTWIEGNGHGGRTMRGTQVYALAGTNMQRFELDGKYVGCTFEDSVVRYCYLGDMRPADVSRPRPEQARSLFESIELALQAAGMSFTNVFRTWLYIDRILEWYQAFNPVRTAFFLDRGVFEGVVPASTGVGVGNPHGAALVADVLALQPKSNAVQIQPVPSPMQCPAIEYRSSFSRATEAVWPDHRALYVSGTASIDRSGKTAYPGNVEKQIELTMEVVDAILNARGMDWTNVARTVAYFKDMHDLPLFHAYCEKYHLPRLPLAIAHADICRGDLLFELEADAFVAR